jgi:hypothetical protein
MSSFKSLCDLLKTEVVHKKIITDGNCFFHALEYALGNCDLEANQSKLYRNTRIEVATFSIQDIKRNFPEELKKYKEEQVRTKNDIERYKEWTKKKIRFLERFKTNNEYSTEDIIYHAAAMKKKILCIVEEEIPNKMSIICPNIPFLRENIVMMVHSGGNHYNTFLTPVYLSKEFVHALKNYKLGPFDSLMEENGVTVKDITLDRLLSSIIKSRLTRRRTINKNSSKTKTSKSRTSKTFKTRKKLNLLPELL